MRVITNTHSPRDAQISKLAHARRLFNECVLLHNWYWLFTECLLLPSCHLTYNGHAQRPVAIASMQACLVQQTAGTSANTHGLPSNCQVRRHAPHQVRTAAAAGRNWQLPLIMRTWFSKSDAPGSAPQSLQSSGDTCSRSYNWSRSTNGSMYIYVYMCVYMYICICT